MLIRMSAYTNEGTERQINPGDIIKSYSMIARDYIGTIFMFNQKFDELYQEFMQINKLNLCIIKKSNPSTLI